MSTAPVAVPLVLNVLIFIGGYFLFDKAHRHSDSILFSVLFLCSGMPALIYQIVWQRVLFSIYGVNSQSVAVVVTAFMLGLGIGSLAGGRLSARFPRRAILIFGIAELCVAAFGLFSLRIFEPSIAAHSDDLDGRHASSSGGASRPAHEPGGPVGFHAVFCEYVWFGDRLLLLRDVSSARFRPIRLRGNRGLPECFGWRDCLSLFPARKRKHPNDLAVSAKLGCRVHHSGNVAGRPVRFHCPGICNRLVSSFCN